MQLQDEQYRDRRWQTNRIARWDILNPKVA